MDQDYEPVDIWELTPEQVADEQAYYLANYAPLPEPTAEQLAEAEDAADYFADRAASANNAVR